MEPEPTSETSFISRITHKVDNIRSSIHLMHHLLWQTSRKSIYSLWNSFSFLTDVRYVLTLSYGRGPWGVYKDCHIQLIFASFSVYVCTLGFSRKIMHLNLQSFVFIHFFFIMVKTVSRITCKFIQGCGC